MAISDDAEKMNSSTMLAMCFELKRGHKDKIVAVNDTMSDVSFVEEILA